MNCFIADLRDVYESIMGTSMAMVPEGVHHLVVTPSDEHQGVDDGVPFHIQTFPLRQDLPSKIVAEEFYQHPDSPQKRESKELVEKLWRGGGDVVDAPGGCSRISARLVQGLYNAQPAASILIMIDDDVEMFQVLSFTDDDGRPVTLTAGRKQNFDRTVPLEVREVVTSRCIHWIMRQHSSKFTHFDPQIILSYLTEEYTPKQDIYTKLWEDVYDIAALAAKIELKREHNDASFQRYVILSRPSDALEAMGRPIDALTYLSKLSKYHEIDGDLTTSMFKIGPTCAAGLVSVRMEDWPNGEKYHVLALQLYVQHLAKRAEAEGVGQDRSSSLFDPNEIQIQKLFTELINSVYWGWPNPIKPWDRVNGTLPPLSEEMNVMLTLQGLLVQAGWNKADEDGWYRSFSIDVYGLPRRFLKKEYRTTAKAKEKIFESFQAANTRDFRSQILSAKLSNATVTVRDPGIAVVEQIVGGPGTHARSSRSQVRKHMRKQESTAKSGSPCIACGKQPASKCCPCHTVTYCSRECQVSHWKQEHKQYCPNRSRS
mmetsp:Transcript_2054/g.4742  ORF Transcript_2054/g.4742 Transcript_2054/m.4742 type:complete len:542 (+) Transcript_2054:90-1715(+)